MHIKSGHSSSHLWSLVLCHRVEEERQRLESGKKLRHERPWPKQGRGWGLTWEAFLWLSHMCYGTCVSTFMNTLIYTHRLHAYNIHPHHICAHCTHIIHTCHRHKIHITCISYTLKSHTQHTHTHMISVNSGGGQDQSSISSCIGIMMCAIVWLCLYMERGKEGNL